MTFPESLGWIALSFLFGVGCGVKLLHWAIRRGWTVFERKKH